MPDEGKECGMKGIACEMTGIALARGNGILYKDRCPLFLSFFPSFFFLSSSRNNLYISLSPSDRTCHDSVAVHSLALVFVEESGVIGVVSALLAFSLVV